MIYVLDDNDNMQIVTAYISDVEIAKYQFYSNGCIKAITRYKRGKINGDQYYFFQNGKLERKENFRDGLQWGKAYYYYPSGVVQYERNWEDGKKVGYCQDYYDTTGRIKVVNLYNEDGQLFYKKTFDENGHLLSEEGSEPIFTD